MHKFCATSLAFSPSALNHCSFRDRSPGNLNIDTSLGAFALVCPQTMHVNLEATVEKKGVETCMLYVYL